jgi:hypothetical protein
LKWAIQAMITNKAANANNEYLISAICDEYSKAIIMITITVVRIKWALPFDLIRSFSESVETSRGLKIDE